MSYKAWIADRVFALVPVSNVFLKVSTSTHLFLYAISIGVLLLLLLKPQRIYLLLVVIIEFMSCLLDQNRWHPWEYQYILMAVVCWFYYYKKTEAYFLCSFILATIYLYSGLHKINTLYVHYFWKQTILLKFFKLASTANYFPFVVKFGYLTALLEAIAGLALLVNYKVKFAAWFLITMHCFILLVIGPLGINYNHIVWIWNIAMIGFVYVVFIKESPAKSSFLNPIFPNAFIVLLMGLLPILSFFKKWDYYLSSCLYSAKPPTLIIKTKTPPLYFLQNKLAFIKKNDSLYTIHVQTWAMKEMGVPPYPEKRVLLKVKEYAMQQFNFKEEEFVWRELDK